MAKSENRGSAGNDGQDTQDWKERDARRGGYTEFTLLAAGLLTAALLCASNNEQPQSIPSYNNYERVQPSQSPPGAVGSAITYE